MKPYDHKKIEPKWQKTWEKNKLYQAKDFGKKGSEKKFYGLIEFPYPSGDGLHVGHIRSNTAMDIISRKRRAEGFNVLYPIGWDAFGLPTENYAIKTGIQPAVVTKKNTDTFRKQLKSLGFAFDWSREINTTDPKYYKWTQWIFLQFLKQGLAYKKRMAINWCPKDKIGLANEEVIDGKCERCGTVVEKREKEQWMLAITKYADRLDKDLDSVDFLEKIKIQQRNWIGRSEGSELYFNLNFKKNPEDNKRRDPEGNPARIKVFTTRADTLFGATYIVLSPEHLWVTLATDEKHDVLLNKEEVIAYVEKAKLKTFIERTSENKEKTGVEIKGVVAINPATKEEIPIYVADYVLADYGTGAIMAVPAYDERDLAFADKFNLPIKKISLDFSSEEITKKYGGELVTTFKLRDWIFSRQRYWGEPIPVILCDDCGVVPVPDKDLPVTLPKVKNYQPTDDGESPLSAISSWVNVKCPKCKKKAKRETDTMPNWAGSSWYYLRYADPKNSKIFADAKKLKYWTPVDWYNGGMEHTTLHLLYSRFWHKFLFDLNLVPTNEPYQKRTSQGLILAEGGEKMSKSKGNVVNPDALVQLYGADTLRVYEMFAGPFDQPFMWSTDNMIGSRRFLDKLWRLQEKAIIKKTNQKDQITQSQQTEILLQKTIKKVSDDIESMGFNTAISSLMILLNTLEKEESITVKTYSTVLKLVSPFAPHITEELWQMVGNKGSVHVASWPSFDENLIKEEKITFAVQINGKTRATLDIVPNQDQKVLEMHVLSLPEVQKWLEGKEPKRLIYVQNRLINIVI